MRNIPKAYVMLTLLAAAFTSLLVFGISSDALSADSALTHNSNRFGICKDSGGTEIPALSGTSEATCTATPGNTWTPSAKWSTIGGWGLPSKQYGEFVCETCHERGSDNIKNVRKIITAPSGTFPPGAWSTVNFQSTTGFGDDTGGHSTSQKVCEVCHSQTDYHRFNTAGQTVFNHNNNTDCIVCHKHNVGFKQLDCNACHGNPPTVDTPGVANGLASFSGKTTGSTTAGKHATHATTLGYVCDNCHSNSVMPFESSVKPGFWDISIGFSNFGSTTGSYSGWTSLSYNNTLGAGGRTCSTVYCHGSTLDGSSTTATWTGSVACGDCHKNNAAAMATSTLGNHARHAGNGVGQMNLVCSDCHGTNGAGGQGHVSGKIEWSLNTSSNKFGPNAKYWGSTSGAAANRAPSGSYQSCSSVYCHSNVQTTPPGGALTYGTPQWGAGSVTCSTASCHGGDTDPKIASASHNKHVSSPYSFVCSTCHNNAGKNTSKHADRNVDVAFSGSGSYNGTAAPGDAYGSCSSVYCHSSVQADGGVGAGNTRTVAWNGTVVCGDCHSIPPATGRHAKHADIGNYGFDCWACHNNAGINKGTGIPTAFHANGIVNMSIDSTYGATATYSLGSQIPGDGYGTCGTTYCHSAGTGGTAQSDGRSIAANTSPIWSGSAACDSCHAGTATGPAYASGTPKTNSHNGHVVTHGYTCEDCHSGTVNASNVIIDMSKHVNKLYDVSGAKITSYTFAADGGTCANSCHFSSTPKWGGTVGCGDCHAVPPTTAGHPTHTSGLTSSTGVYGSTTDASTATDYGFNCGNCHPFTIANHGNGSVEVSVAQGGTGLRAKNSGTAAYTGTIGNQNGTCNGVYCHSDGSASPAFAATPAWNTTFAAVGGDACAKCHGNSPSTNAHAKHVVGIHYYNIYTGTIGLATPGSTLASSHGNAEGSTTINCNVCHSGTVTSSANDKNTVCATVSCHGTGGTTQGNAAVADRSFHVNGTADIAFAAINIASKAQIRDDITTVAELNNNWTRNANSYKTGSTPYDTSADPLDVGSVWDGNLKTCSSIACHNGNQATWNSSPISCGSCHTSLTN